SCRTVSTMSAPASRLLRSTTFAPAASYAASSKPAATPAPCSIETSAPAPTSRAALSGTSATLRSPGPASRGTAIFMTAPGWSVVQPDDCLQFRSGALGHGNAPIRVVNFGRTAPSCSPRSLPDVSDVENRCSYAPNPNSENRSDSSGHVQSTQSAMNTFV